MISSELLSEIEGGDLPSELSIANDLRMLVRIAARNQAITSLVWELEEPTNQQCLAERINLLASAQPEEGFRHPNDGIIAVYLFLLSRVDPVFAGQVAGSLGEQASFCWASHVIVDCIQRLRPISDLRVMRRTYEDRRPEQLYGQQPKYAGVA